MKRLTILLFIALSMTAALGAFGAGAASAETTGLLCTTASISHECGSAYAKGTEVTATLSSSLEIKGANSLLVNKCTGSSIHFNYNGESGLEYKSASFSGCGKAMTDATSGELVVIWKEGTDNGSTNAFASTFFEMDGGVYSLTNEGVGTEVVGGTSPKLVFKNAPLVGVSGKTYSDLTLTAEYSLSPTPMYVEKALTPGNLCETAPVSGVCSSVYPAGTVFTATQVPKTTVRIVGAFSVLITSCESSTIKLKYNGFHNLSYAGSSWSGCVHPTSDISAGSINVKYRPGSNEALYGGTGQLLKVEGTPFGTVTLGLLGDGIEITQGASPKLKFNSAPMSGLSTGAPKMSGEYTLSPSPLYIGS